MLLTTDIPTTGGHRRANGREPQRLLRAWDCSRKAQAGRADVFRGLQLNTGRPFDQTPPQLVDQPIRAGQLLRPLVLPEQLIDQLVRDLHVAHHGPPSGPPDGIAPTAATPRSSRPRRTNQSDTQKSAHYPICVHIGATEDAAWRF